MVQGRVILRNYSAAQNIRLYNDPHKYKSKIYNFRRLGLHCHKKKNFYINTNIWIMKTRKAFCTLRVELRRVSDLSGILDQK